MLHLGLYQLFWLQRIPDHAAVHETVELAKHLGFGPQAGFLNAVLRGYIRERDANADGSGGTKTIRSRRWAIPIQRGWSNAGRPMGPRADVAIAGMEQQAAARVCAAER